MIINTGEEVNQGGYALLNVTVSGNNNDGGTVTATGTNATYTATTDNNGQASILIYEPGTYSVSYAKSTDTSDTQSVTIGFGGATYSVSLTIIQELSLIVSNATYGGQSLGDGSMYCYYGTDDYSAPKYYSPYIMTFEVSANDVISVVPYGSTGVRIMLNGTSYIATAIITHNDAYDIYSTTIRFDGSTETNTTLTVNPGDTIVLDTEVV